APDPKGLPTIVRFQAIPSTDSQTSGRHTGHTPTGSRAPVDTSATNPKSVDTSGATSIEPSVVGKQPSPTGIPVAAPQRGAAMTCSNPEPSSDHNRSPATV